ncbi:MAG TPA: hypothetical protein VGN26_21770 [Armatimonadota bacterium]
MVEAIQSILPLIVVGVVLLFLFRSPSTRLPNRVEAERKADSLLRRLLSTEEYQQLMSHGYLRVKSPNVPGRVYLVPRYRGLVRVYESGRAVMRLCVGPTEPMPDADVVLVHKLMIEADEEHYLRSANAF